ncbi:MAG: hypothetical protein IPG89_09330 [Bacteroidetes bacterium]|nr:hypothetical protein [Bacteroidota bacterium]
MKKLLLLFVFASTFVNAQVLISNFSPSGNILADSSETPGQSFVAPVTSLLSRIDIKVNSVTTPGNYNLIIHSGEGMSSPFYNVPSLFISTAGTISFYK